MAAWLVALKAILPHVGTVITAAKPLFTAKSAANDANPTRLLQQQIAELQSAASSNAESTKELAAQLQTAIKAIEQAATVAQARLRQALIVSAVALGASAVALCLALFVVLSR